MTVATRTFFLLTIAAALGLFASYWPFDALSQYTWQDWGGVVSIIVMASFSEVVAFHVGSGRAVRTSLSFLPYLAAIVLFEPPVSVLAIAVTVCVSNVYPTRRQFIKAAFNVAQASLAAGAGAALYWSMAGDTEKVDPLAFFAVAIAFFATNLSLTSIAVSLMRGESLARVFRQLAGSKGTSLLFDILASPIAVFLVILYRELHFLGLVIIVLPLLLIRYSYEYRIKLQQANSDLLRVLVKAIETRDPYTSGHSIRVAKLAKAIAHDLQLPDSHIDDIEQAALLHDIGKIDPQYSFVIAKPHDLSDDERSLIKTHASHGAKLLEELSTVSQAVIVAVRHHHEKFDGTGYPDRLAGEGIPLASRIIMLCDSIDAMLSDRPYRKALPIDFVQSELVRCSGTQFDPAIVKVVLEKKTLTRAKEEATAAGVDHESDGTYRNQLTPLPA